MDHKSLILTLLLIMLSAQAFGLTTTFDPLTVAVGARALGMGRAYTAASDDADIMFTNPAGLGEIDAFNFTSMSGTIFEEVNYSVLGGVYPLGGRGAIGIGYASSRILGIELRDSDGTLLKRSNFEDRVIFASYGKKIDDKLSLGINLKYYDQDGSELNDGDGTGFNVDVGLLQKDLGWVSWGIVAKNILSSSTIRYKNGEEENLPQMVRIGTRFALLGDDLYSANPFPIGLTMLYDANFSLEGSKPTTTHIGAEAALTSDLTVRAGIDQDPLPGRVQSVATYGVSLRFAGLGFHYAYHPYGDPESVTQYFSISFDERGWPPEGPNDSIAKEPVL